MILYFSATGNCEFVAKQIASAIGDKAVYLKDTNGQVALKPNEALGMVVPTYFWGLPKIVEDFLQNVNIKCDGDPYIFCVATYGTTTGQIDYFANKILHKKGLKLNASFSIKTVDNYTVMFSVNDKNQISQMLKEEARQILEVIEVIKQRQKVFINKDKKSLFMCRGARFFYEKARKTKHFNVDQKCISCGLCAKNCPEGAIKMIEGKPHWIKQKCTLCFKCLHRCPKFAINYDNKTQGNGQYIHP